MTDFKCLGQELTQTANALSVGVNYVRNQRLTGKKSTTVNCHLNFRDGFLEKQY